MPPRAGMPLNGRDADDSAQVLIDGDMPVEDRISFLLALLEDHPHDADLVGMSLQYLVALAQAHREVVMPPDAVLKVFGIMQNHGDNENMMEGCLFFLARAQVYHITQHAETIPSVRQTDRVEAIVAVMNTFQDNAIIQRNGSLVLFPLGHEDLARSLLLETDSISALIFAMARLPNDMDVQRTGCLAILELLENDPGVHAKEEISRAGGVVVLFTFLKQHCEHPVSNGDIMEAGSLKCACEAISFLSEDSDDSVETSILEMQGIAILLSFIECQTVIPSLQFEAIEILRILGDSSAAVSDAFVAAGGVSTLTAIMNENRDNESLVAGVLVAFVSLAPNSPVMVDAIAVDGGIATIVSIMPRYIDSVYLQAFAIGALGVCASTEGTFHVQDALRSIPNIVRCVVMAMRKHASDKTIQVTGAVLLSKFTFSLNMSIDIALNGGLTVLVDAMKSFPVNLDLHFAAVALVANSVEGAAIAKAKSIDVRVDLVEFIKDSGLVPAIVNILNLSLDNDEWYQDPIVCLRKMAEMNGDIKQQIISNDGIKLLDSIQKKCEGESADEASILLNLLNDTDNENSLNGIGSRVSKESTT